MNAESPIGLRSPHRQRLRLGAVTALALCAALALAGCAQLEALSQGGWAAAPAADSAPDAEVGEAEARADDDPGPVPEPTEEPEPGQLYEWNGDGKSITRIVIDTNLQRARFYAGNEQVGWTTVATGVSSHATPRGEFIVIEKVANKRSNLYGKIVNASGAVIKHGADAGDRVPPGGRFVGASMPNFMRMTYDGIGMHAGPIPRPGRPASHGCIRMPKTMASAVFRHVSVGTPVTVVGNGPDYGNYAAQVRQRQREEQARRAAAAAAKEGTALDALDAEVEVMRQAEPADAAEPAAANRSGAATDTEPQPAAGESASSSSRAGLPSSSPAAASSRPAADAQQEPNAQPAPDPQQATPDAQPVPDAQRAAPETQSPPDAQPAPEPSPPARAQGPASDGEEPAPAAPADANGSTPEYHRPPAPPPEVRAAALPAGAGPSG